MMPFQRMAAPLVIAGAIALTGCLKSNQTYTIYPDGSGKSELRMTFLGMMAQMMKSPGAMGGGEGAAKADPFDALKKSLQGKVYWTNLHSEDGADGSYTIAGTAYFEDVNQVQLEKGGSISWKKNDDGGNTFEITQSTPDEFKGGDDANKTPEQKQQEEQSKAMMRSMMAGFEMKVSVVMPGAVKSSEGMAADGRKASYALTEKDLGDIIDKKKGPPPSTFKVVAGAPAGLDDEVAQFKKELAAAKTTGGATPEKKE
jgi:hypothetical protein